ncbi:MAG: efflux RND transporter periplasmic adaptor subunit [Bosea sp.]|uniref:efflux RND transporter periplasmic adaptor subunit n=1 Tax=unclassified Bosea (in: a-proteobacteria) TaxID=2653178 RepID=UPI001AC20D0F|nr:MULTISPECIES: efflux RND transporter periplasmic adaptor subunit [unclassified Bosea (in: a-proteobacteria)]MBN9455734.1 efflux RND transporter periplasmic adaptor subunit [Bosea sp. (in: a-proteobacteria)]
MTSDPAAPRRPAPAIESVPMLLRACTLRALLAAIVVPAALAAPALAQPQPATGAPANGPSVTVTHAKTTEIVQSVLVSGSIIAREEVLVSPQVDGLSIVAVLAEEGDKVAQGQVLARLDRTTLDVQKAQNEAQIARSDAAIAQANAQIAEADANLVQANNAFERTKALRDSGNASIETFDQRAAAARSAQARANSARQALAIAAADLALAKAQGRDIAVKLERTEIRAPKAGIVSRRTAKLGATASMLPTSEPLYRIIADGAVELEAQVAEVDLPSLRLGQPVAVTPAGAKEALRGTIRLIAPEVDKASRLGRVRVALDGNPSVAIGSFARGIIETGRKRAVTLPLSAITYTRSGATVQTVQDGKIATRKVTLGLTGGGRAEIATGLAQGETVVARAGTFVRDGDLITPVPTN